MKKLIAVLMATLLVALCFAVSVFAEDSSAVEESSAAVEESSAAAEESSAAAEESSADEATSEDAASVEESKADDTDTPATGDAGIAVFAVLAVVSGAAVVVLKKRA